MALSHRQRAERQFDKFDRIYSAYDTVRSIEQEITEAVREDACDLLVALKDALPYIEQAYECAFPNEMENRRVLRQAREAIKQAEGP